MTINVGVSARGQLVSLATNETAMIRRPLHLVRAPVDANERLDVLETYENMYGQFALISELWRLVGNDERASAIEHVVTRSYEHDTPVLETPDIMELTRLIEGLDSAIVGPLTDEQRLIPKERVRELRERSKFLDLDESRGELATFAVSEAMVGVENLQSILNDALSLGAHIVFD